MSSTSVVLFLTLDYNTQPPTKSAIFYKKSVCAKKNLAQNTPICNFKGLLFTLVHEV